MPGKVTLYAPNGDIIDMDALKRPLAEAAIGSVRRVEPEHPSWGLSPEGLGTILSDSEQTDPSRLYALLDDIFEKEWHYRGVLGTRRMALAQLPVTVDPASDDPEHVAHADFIRLVLNQPEMMASKFDLSDALNKGISFGDIAWDTSEGQWMPKRLDWIDQRWFRFDRVDLTTPRLLDDNGQPQPIKPYKTVIHRPRLNSGLPIRDGLGRAAAWAWMFKNYDIKSWMIFLERYGLPLRIGKFPTSATPVEKRAFLRSLRMMARDAAAIIPEGFSLELPKAEGGGSGDAFETLANYFDEQLSKLVLGQTGTTDASKGGYAVGKVHEGVKDAICLYDGFMLATSINRDLARPAIDLNYGPQKAYPTVKIGIAQDKDLDLVLKHIEELVDRGLDVEASQVYAMLGLTEPAKGDDVKLLKPKMVGVQPASAPPPEAITRAGQPGGGAPRDPARLSADPQVTDPPSDSFDEATAAIIGEMQWVPDVGALADALAKCTTREQALEVLRTHLDGLGTDKLAEKLLQGRFAARLAGETGA